MDDSWPYLCIVFLVVFSAFFSGSEIAFASVNEMRLKKRAESGDLRAKNALYISEHFDDALSTILIGNNLVNIAATSISTVVAVNLIGPSGTMVSTFIMTVLILVFGEICPKIIAKQQSDKFALLASYPLRVLMLILKPVIIVIIWIVNPISKIWDKASQKEPIVTEEELVTIIESVEENGVIDEDRSELLQSALEFSNKRAQEILTPRTDMVAIDINDDMNSIIEVVFNSPYSRIPVFEKSIDNIIGILHISHFLRKLADSEQVDIRSILIETCFIHKTMKLPEIFAELNRRRMHMAIVVDEYGGTMGCITMEDVLEEIVGEIWDETDKVENDFIRIEENKYEVSGDLSIQDFLEYMNIYDNNFKSDYMTVGGWAMEMLDGLPNVNDKFKYKNLILKVTGIDGLRVTKLSVEIISESYCHEF